MTEERKTPGRFVIALVLAVSAVLGSFSISSAAPTKAQVDAARAKVEALNRQLEVLTERYNTARVVLQESKSKMAAAARREAQAQTVADAARAQLNARAVAAFTDQGMQLNVLLGSQSLSEFSDRLAFMGAVATNDAELAARADNAAIQAEAARLDYQSAAKQQQDQLRAIARSKADIASALSQQKQLYARIYGSYQRAQAAAAAAARAAAQQATTPPSSGSGGTAPGPIPPPSGNAAAIAIAAARSVLGTQYVWGAADPSVGFDCSGLVLWAYAHAGVSLPHSSAMMYAMLPHLTQSQLQPGDLVFFFSPVSHVSIYLGGGMMISADHPGPGGEVQIEAMWWGDFVGGGRISG